MITVERCKQAEYTARRILELRKEIEAAYNTYRSPSPAVTHRKNGNQVNHDPVTEALHRIDCLSDQLCDCLDFMISFEDDIQQIESSVIRAIIRSRYILGDNWQKCTYKILGIRNSDSARNRLYRYLKRTECEKNADFSAEV